MPLYQNLIPAKKKIANFELKPINNYVIPDRINNSQTQNLRGLSRIMGKTTKTRKAHLRLLRIRGRRGNALVAEHHVADGQYTADHHDCHSDQIS